MLKIIVGASKNFTDQMRVQQTLRALYHRDPDSVLVVDNSNPGSRLVGAVWAAVGGATMNFEPNWKRDHKDAGRIRDDEVLRTGGDLCLSFELGIGTEREPWITTRCREVGIHVQVVNLLDFDVIDAD